MGNLTDKEYNKEKYGWSKYGRNQTGEPVDTEGKWSCQTCGQLQSDGCPHYILPMNEIRNEFLRICSVCKHIQLENKLSEYDYLVIISLVREEQYG